MVDGNWNQIVLNKMKLLIKPLNNYAESVYTSTTKVSMERQDSGYDLIVCSDYLVEPWSVCRIPLGIAAQPAKSNESDELTGYYLYPRSSISKTPLGLANSVGIIDIGYRGEICAMVRNYSSEPYQIKQGDKLFQLCLPSLKPFEVFTVEELDASIRGSGGFGSTGLKV